MRIIYLDATFAMDFLMDLVLLRLTGAVLCRAPRFWRCAAGAAAGAAVTVGALLLGEQVWVNLIGFAVGGFAAGGIAFGFSSVRAVLVWWLCLLLSAGALGGGMFCLLLLCWPGSLRTGAGGLRFSGQAIWLLVLAALLALFVCETIRLLAARNARRPGLCSIRVTWDGRQEVLRALIDSGCVLRESKTGLDVIVVETHCCAGLFDARPLLPVPFRSLGGSGVLLAARPDRVELLQGGRNIICQALIAKSGGLGLGAQKIQALVPLTLAGEREKVEYETLH